MAKYSYDSQNNLLPQIMFKSDLAQYYGVTLRQLRRELENYITPSRKHRYTAKEVQRIFEILGTPTRWDMEKYDIRKNI